MKQEELKAKMEEITFRAATYGWAKAGKEVPYFIYRLYRWVESENMRAALTEFCACFVEGAVLESMSILTQDLESIRKQAERIERKSQEVAEKVSTISKEAEGDGKE